MLIPVTRVPAIIARTYIGSLAPTSSSLCAHLPALPKFEKYIQPQTVSGADPMPPAARLFRTYQSQFPARPTFASPFLTGMLRLYGMRNTTEFIGPTILRYVMVRNFSGTTKSNNSDVPTTPTGLTKSGDAAAGKKLITKQEKQPGSFTLAGEPYTKRPFLSRLARLETRTEQAALARLENSPWLGKYTQVKIAKDGTCFYGQPAHSHFFDRVYPLMVTTDGVCIERQPGMTVTILGSWDVLTDNTSIRTIAAELGRKHTTYIRNISGEINPFCFSKTEEELNNATDEDRFDHIRRAAERNEPIYMI